MIHATALFWMGGGILVRGPSGAGKSLLAARLIEDGGVLVADDRVFASARGGRLLAAPLAANAGLLELRGRGPVKVPHERSAVIGLVVDHVADAALERLPDDAAYRTELLGVSLPRQEVPRQVGHAVLLVADAIRTIRDGRPIQPCASAEDGQDAARF